MRLFVGMATLLLLATGLRADEPKSSGLRLGMGSANRKLVFAISTNAETIRFLAGWWLSSDAELRPVIFSKEGAFYYGYYWDAQKQHWRLAQGTYRVESDGTINATAKHDRVTLVQQFRIKNGLLTSGVGSPAASIWKKVADQKD
jgi:hypothetical protein